MTKAINAKTCAECSLPLRRVNGRFKKRCSSCQTIFEKSRSIQYEATRKSKRNPIILELTCMTCGKALTKRKLGAISKYCESCKETTTDSKGKKTKPQHVIDRSRKHHFKKHYGLTLDQRETLLQLQKGKCAICLDLETSDNFLQVDHDHSCCPSAKSCGKCIRGLICPRCNRGLGMMNDNAELASKLVRYIKENSKVKSK